MRIDAEIRLENEKSLLILCKITYTDNLIV